MGAARAHQQQQQLSAFAAAAAATVRANYPRMTRTLAAILLPGGLLYLGAGFGPPGSVFATKTYLSSVTVRGHRAEQSRAEQEAAGPGGGAASCELR